MAESIICAERLGQIGISIAEESWYGVSYVGTGTALLAAGLVSPTQLLPPEGRRYGRAGFFPDGSAVPKGLTSKLKTMPGSKVVVNLGAERYKVTITATVADQDARRLAASTTSGGTLDRHTHDAAPRADTPINLKHEFGPFGETWTGTKSQLQAAGIGVGIAFPGEANVSTESVTTSDTAGYEVVITPCSNRADDVRPAHRYLATSRYLDRSEEELTTVEIAPGLYKGSSLHGHDVFLGSGAAVAAAEILRMDQLPGQPGRGKARCAYHPDGEPDSGTGMASRRAGHIVVTRVSGGKFRVEVRVSEGESAKRDAQWRAESARFDALVAKARRERMKARGAMPGGLIGPASVEAYRATCLGHASLLLDVLWSQAFCQPLGAFAFKITKTDQEWDAIASAFGAIRDALETASVVTDAAKLEATVTRLSAAARRDAAFASFMRNTLATE